MAAPPELSIVRSGNGAPRFCLGGELLPPLVPCQKRPAADVRALMAATAGLAFFGQMRAELRGDWRQAHAELCAQMEPVLCESDQLLFEGVHGLRRPLVLVLYLRCWQPSPSPGAATLHSAPWARLSSA